MMQQLAEDVAAQVRDALCDVSAVYGHSGLEPHIKRAALRGVMAVAVLSVRDVPVGVSS